MRFMFLMCESGALHDRAIRLRKKAGSERAAPEEKGEGGGVRVEEFMGFSRLGAQHAGRCRKRRVIV